MHPIPHPTKKQLPWIGAVFFSCIFLLAAYGKLFYPSQLLSHLDFWAALFEIALVVFLCLFRTHSTLWLFIALVSATWGGYAFYWHQLNLPCDCLGSMITIPTSLSLSCDALFFVFSLLLARTLQASYRLIGWTCLAACFTALLGFGVAHWVYSGIS